MYDLQEVIAQNNKAAVWAMMRGEKAELAHSPIPREWPLSWLAEKLQVGPPLLNEIVNGLVDVSTQQEFITLVRDYLPAHEKEILTARLSQRVRLFCYYWAQERYPFPEGVATASMDRFTAGIPVQLMGLSYEAYHELDFRPAYLALLSLVIYPFDGDVRDLEDDEIPYNPFEPMKEIERWEARNSDVDWLKGLIQQLKDGGEWMAPVGFKITKINRGKIRIDSAELHDQAKRTLEATVKIAQHLGIEVICKVGQTAAEKVLRGARVALLEALKDEIGPGLVSRVRAEGWDPADLHRAVDGTEYEGVGYFADWVLSETRCAVLDADYGDVEFMEGYGEPEFKWTKYNVDMLTSQWPRVKEYRQKIDALADRLETNLAVQFERLLDFLVPRVKVEAPPRLSPFHDPTQLPGYFDQDSPYDEDEEDEDVNQ